MALIHLENWDGATPPAAPAGWTFATQITTTATFSGGITPTSAPNGLMLQPGGVTTPWFATWNTQDGVSGNVTVQANFNFLNQPGAATAASVIARGGATPLLSASGTFYAAELLFANNQASLVAYSAGTPTTIGGPVAVTGYLNQTWYTLALTCNGTSLTMSIQRITDGFYLNGSGLFTSSPASCISVTDSSISGQGYSGLFMKGQSNVNIVYSDDWSVTSLTAPAIPPNAPVVVRIPAQYYPVNQF